MESPELDGLFRSKLSNLEDFRRNQSELWFVVNSAYLATKTLLIATATIPDLTVQEVHRVMMWWTVLEYQMESFFLLISRRLDEGLALLRMASELARDVARIGEKPSRLDVWFKRARKDIRRQYRIEFKFDESDALEKHIYALYNLASDWGVHGHITGSASLKPTAATPAGILRLEVPDVAVFRALEVWLGAFYPLHDLCARTFIADRPEPVLQPYKTFLDLWKEFDTVFALYRENVAKDRSAESGLVH